MSIVDQYNLNTDIDDENIFEPSDIASNTDDKVLQTEDKQVDNDNTDKQDNKQTKDNVPKKVKQSPEFNPKTLIHYLNNCYGNKFIFKNGNDIEDTTDTKHSKIIIDISKIDSLDEFRFVMCSIDAINKGLKRKERWDKITHSVFDFKARGILTTINDFNLSTPKTDDYKLLMDKIVPQLHFDNQNKFDMQECKSAIIKYLRSPMIRYKLMNKLFPHPDIKQNINNDDKKQGTFLNKLYIQTMSNYHDLFIKYIFEHNNTTVDNLYNIIYEKYSNTYKNKVTKDMLERFEYDKLTSKEFVKSVDKNIIDIIRRVNTERNIANKYLKYFNTIGKNKETYSAYIKYINQFITSSKQLEKQQINLYKDFVNMFVNVFKWVNEPLKYNNNFISFIKDCDLDTVLLFGQKFKQAIKLLLTTDNTTIQYNDNVFVCQYHKTNKSGNDEVKTIEGEIIQETKYSPQRVYSNLAKIGLYVKGHDIRTDIRVGIGCIIMDHIREQAEKHIKEGKRMRKCVYIKW